MGARIVLTVFDSRHSQRKQRLLTFLRSANGSGLCNRDLFTVTYTMDLKKNVYVYIRLPNVVAQASQSEVWVQYLASPCG